MRKPRRILARDGDVDGEVFFLGGIFDSSLRDFMQPDGSGYGSSNTTNERLHVLSYITHRIIKEIETPF